LLLDGVYRSSTGVPVFHEARAPSAAEVEGLLNRIIQRIVKLLTRTGAPPRSPAQQVHLFQAA